MSKWTKKEIEVLKKNYKTSSWDKLLELLPNRTKGAIKRKASELQIKKKNRKPRWFEEEIKILRKFLNPSCTWSYGKLLSLLPDRSQQSIRLKRRKIESELQIGWCDYCGTFYSKVPQELSDHMLQCHKNPKSDNYIIPEGFIELKEKIYSSSIKQEIYDLFYNKGYSFSAIRHFLKKEHDIITYQQKGGQIRNLYGFPDLFLEIIEVTTWREYKKLLRRNIMRAKSKSGFTEKLKEEVKELFNFTCALCEETKSLHVHHIDGDSKNNEKINLIPLCEEHHKLAGKLKCLICGNDLVKISKGLIIDNKDISELKDINAYSCIKHTPLSLKMYEKGELVSSVLYMIVNDKLNKRDSEIQKKIKEEIHNLFFYRCVYLKKEYSYLARRKIGYCESPKKPMNEELCKFYNQKIPGTCKFFEAKVLIIQKKGRNERSI